MYDIYFDLNNMHQVVDDTPADQLSQLYDELSAIGENLEFDLIGALPIEDDDDYAVVVKKSKGCRCKKCGETYPYAEPNQQDGSFKCWSCRNF